MKSGQNIDQCQEMMEHIPLYENDIAFRVCTRNKLKGRMRARKDGSRRLNYSNYSNYSPKDYHNDLWDMIDERDMY
jgi:hypothetical protein